MPLFLSGISVLGLSIGGLLSSSINRFFPKKLPYVYVICGGNLIGIITFDLIPHTLIDFEFKGVLLGALTGYIIMLLIGHFFHHEEEINVSERTLGFLVAAIFFHHIIMGFSYGAVNLFNSYSFLTAIILHQIPEGIAIMTTLLVTRIKGVIFLYIITILSVVFGVSAFLGETIKETARTVDTLLTGTAIGTLLYVTLNEIVGKSKKQFGWIPLLLMTTFGAIMIKVYISLLAE
ncbi:ZIP family metal transporter [Siminovitchia sp. 179-K 8D1 HS]|uniref:ZIP family metal transporter n=1 Tax=Siminovitchia sp. 179-K 8D1 HS TaxID=3142385 RepID=UPI0039A193BC